MAKVVVLLREPNGKWSFSRTIGVALIVWYLIVASVLAWRTGTLPDVPQNVMLLIVGLYGVNRLSYAWESRGRHLRR